MSAITINLDPVALREATTQAIMGTLTPEVRADIIQKAISALLTPSTDSWDRNRSPIQKAFDDAVAKIAREVASEHVKADAALMLRIKELVRAASDKMFSMDQDKLAQRMADAFCDSIRKES